MPSSQLDSIGQLFALRRSRRGALAAAGGSLAVFGLGRGAVAQDGSPVALPAGADEGASFMFVQTFGAGSLVPLEGETAGLLLTADHLAGQTVYFSDRPERIVGMVPTTTLLGAGNPDEGLGFTPADPPNAALVLDDGAVLVIELIDPTYDAATGLVTYQVRVLEAVEQLDLQLAQEPLSAAEAARDFTAASLFIDDCPDGNIVCSKDGDTVGSIPSAFCFGPLDECCLPCHTGNPSFWVDQCSLAFAGCDGGCDVDYQEAWACLI